MEILEKTQPDCGWCEAYSLCNSASGFCPGFVKDVGGRKTVKYYDPLFGQWPFRRAKTFVWGVREGYMDIIYSILIYDVCPLDLNRFREVKND
jgi:hypothetical protein